MPESKLPYLTAYGNITKGLNKVKSAAVPDRFSQDHLENTLGMSGGGARPLISYLKRTGMLAPDGTPTDLYRKFRNPTTSGAAAAEALRTGYAPLFQMDEKVYELDDAKLKGLVVQATGAEPTSGQVKSVVKPFAALNDFAEFGSGTSIAEDEISQDTQEAGDTGGATPISGELRLGYTINLNLPSTSDVGVYNAIFKSLKENLLRDLG